MKEKKAVSVYIDNLKEITAERTRKKRLLELRTKNLEDVPLSIARLSSSTTRCEIGHARLRSRCARARRATRVLAAWTRNMLVLLGNFSASRCWFKAESGRPIDSPDPDCENPGMDDD